MRDFHIDDGLDKHDIRSPSGVKSLHFTNFIESG